jgi:hypothetical protein
MEPALALYDCELSCRLRSRAFISFSQTARLLYTLRWCPITFGVHKGLADVSEGNFLDATDNRCTLD